MEVGDTVEVTIKAADQTSIIGAGAYFSSVVSDSDSQSFRSDCAPAVTPAGEPDSGWLSNVGGTVICTGSSEIEAEHFSGVYEMSGVFLEGGLGIERLKEQGYSNYSGPGSEVSGVVAGDGRGGEYRKYGGC